MSAGDQRWGVANGQKPTRNPSNLALRGQRETLRYAIRHPLIPGCGPAETALAITDTAPQRKSTPSQRRNSLLEVPIVVTSVGDNLLIPATLGRKLIYEIVLWNVASQTLALYQGPSATGILKTKLTNFPALTGFSLLFNGNWDMPHYMIDSGQPFVLNLGANAEVDGYLKYRIEHEAGSPF